MQIKGLVKKDPSLNKDSIFLIYNNGNKNIEVRISPRFGSNIYKFKYNGFDIFYSNLRLLKKRGWTGCFILWPYPNRVRNKKFIFEGKTYDLTGIRRLAGNYHLIHGLVDNIKWQIGKIKILKNSVKASTFIEVLPGTPVYKFFPFASRLTLNYILSASGLKIVYEVENNSKLNLPFGFALHPYFPKVNNTMVCIPANHIMENDEELLPTGRLKRVKTTSFDLNQPCPVKFLNMDHVYTSLSKSKHAFIDFRGVKFKIYFKTSQDFTHTVLYTKEKPYFCLENQTGSTDMINLHTKGQISKRPHLIKSAHLIILKPKSKHEGFLHYKIGNY